MSGRYVLVTLVPRERTLIRDALTKLREVYLLSQVELDTFDDLMRRIPDPKDD